MHLLGRWLHEPDVTAPLIVLLLLAELPFQSLPFIVEFLDLLLLIGHRWQGVTFELGLLLLDAVDVFSFSLHGHHSPQIGVYS